jgi:hypothetical protein
VDQEEPMILKGIYVGLTEIQDFSSFFNTFICWRRGSFTGIRSAAAMALGILISIMFAIDTL